MIPIRSKKKPPHGGGFLYAAARAAAPIPPNGNLPRRTFFHLFREKGGAKKLSDHKKYYNDSPLVQDPLPNFAAGFAYDKTVCFPAGHKAPPYKHFCRVWLEVCKDEEGDGCYASYPSSVTFGASFPQGGSLGTRDPVHINFQNSLLSLLKAAHIKKPTPLGEGGRGSARMRGSRAAA